MLASRAMSDPTWLIPLFNGSCFVLILLDQALDGKIPLMPWPMAALLYAFFFVTRSKLTAGALVLGQGIADDRAADDRRKALSLACVSLRRCATL
jgi:hypothetical protein